MRRRLLTGAVGATLLMLGACGGQQISVGVTNVPEATGSGSASTVPNAFVASQPPPGPTQPRSLPSGGASGSVKIQIFCRDVSQQLTLLPSILNGVSTPGQLAVAIQQARQANARILRDSPAAIRADVQTLVGFSNRLFDDATANPPKLQDVTGIIADPRYQSAAANVGRYASLHCGSIVPPTSAP